jgi:AcrR family transcriptional regulator
MASETKSENIPYKKQQLIDSAQDLFCKHGIRRVTVEELCRTAEISKMTFYKYFTSKWDIGKSVIDITFEKGLSYYNNMIQKDIPFAEKIEQILKITMIQINSFGAPFIEDLTDKRSPLNTHFSTKQKAVSRLSIEFLTKAKNAGYIKKEIKIPFLLFMLDRTTEFFNDPELISIMPDTKERGYELASLFLYAFSNAKNE